MSFFELDGGDKLKKKASKTTTTAAALKKKKTAAALKKKKTTASAAALKKKKTAALKKKKGGNFLGTVSELFAPSGWENFATAAGLLALEETGRYVNKSKKQKGGKDVDGHHSIEDLEMMNNSYKQTGGGRRKRSQKGGVLNPEITAELDVAFANKKNNARKNEAAKQTIRGILEKFKLISENTNANNLLVNEYIQYLNNSEVNQLSTVGNASNTGSNLNATLTNNNTKHSMNITSGHMNVSGINVSGMTASSGNNASRGVNTPSNNDVFSLFNGGRSYKKKSQKSKK